MKIIPLFILGFTLSFAACSKGGDSPAPTPTPTPTPTETAVAFAITQDPGTGNILGVVGTSQTINVNLSSTLPSSGVNIDVSVKKDVDNSSVFTNSSSSVTANNSIVITGLTPGVLCTATIVVTSKSTATNNKTVSFKLAAK